MDEFITALESQLLTLERQLDAEMSVKTDMILQFKKIRTLKEKISETTASLSRTSDEISVLTRQLAKTVACEGPCTSKSYFTVAHEYLTSSFNDFEDTEIYAKSLAAILAQTAVDERNACISTLKPEISGAITRFATKYELNNEIAHALQEEVMSSLS